MNVLEHLRQALTSLLEDDPELAVLGEDVGEGGMLGLTREAAARDDLRERLLPLPLTPASLPAMAAGLAMSGARPLVSLSSAAALVDGLSALREAAALRWRSGDVLACPLTFLAPFGPGFGTGEDATEAVDALLATVPGLRVVCLGQGAEAPALLRQAVRAPRDAPTTVILMPRSLLLQEIASEDLVTDLDRSLERAAIRRRGSRGCIYAWGACVDASVAAADAADLDVTVVDVASLVPLDRETLVEQSTSGKLVIAHAGPRDHGLGAALSALFADASLLHLDAPIVRVTGSPAPLSPGHEHHALPTAFAIQQAIEEAINY